jgi:hypothetical protein
LTKTAATSPLSPIIGLLATVNMEFKKITANPAR